MKGIIYSTFANPVLQINLLESHKEFILPLKKLAMSKYKKEKGVVKSNREGYQTNFISKNKLCEDFISSIRNHICDYISNIGIKVPFSLKVHRPWINVSGPGSYNVAHCHGENHFSFVFYIQVPEKSGNLIFDSPVLHHKTNMIKHKSYPFWNADSFILFPKVADLVVFPSYMSHLVEPNKSKKIRISLASNLDIAHEV
tara:strand:+ start:757 stop:1353 length:597 start_codon:yes stop_codon:yes gene_type:complete